MNIHHRRMARLGTSIFIAGLLYPLSALFAHIGGWQLGPEFRGPALSSVRVSLTLTGIAMIVITAIGTPVAAYIARCRTKERLLWQALLLVPILLPPLALGILLTLAFGPYGMVGSWLNALNIQLTNSAAAFTVTQVYVGMGYYVLGAVAAFDAVPPILQQQAALLGLTPWRVFLRVTLPLSRLGLAGEVSIPRGSATHVFRAAGVIAHFPPRRLGHLWGCTQNFFLPHFDHAPG